MTPYEPGSCQVSPTHWRRVREFTRRKAERKHFLSFLKKARVSLRKAILVRRRPFFTFLYLIDDRVSPLRAQMDPGEDRRNTKRKEEYYNSKDPIVSNQQKLGSFWNRIAEYFNSSPQLSGFAPREWSQCKQRWRRVNEQVCKFVGSYEAELKEQASGQNENDVMKSAHDIFFNDYQLKFTLEHAWRELRFDQKWRSNSVSRDGPKEKRKEAAETEPELEEVRPPGIKASKAAKRKKHGNEAALDQIESILAKKTIISNRKILDRLLGKNADTLSDQEKTLKNKLISEML
ncbi:PREDICTED: glutathione S-transferase T3-like [Brassica oleracea var. oleracea]|uniref:glutathione S-transferase T3-like n=1 Tax=Brassica oleracea var. oleracea TaxID=109376 RepID=UPI0006A72583|nr:PREDICTED: glutathione S-transferase T3-like [Brassica oleracea var. oleracea]